MLHLQAECPTRSGVESRPGLRDSFLTLLLDLGPHDPLTMKDQGGKDEEAQHVASGVDHKWRLTMTQALLYSSYLQLC